MKQGCKEKNLPFYVQLALFLSKFSPEVFKNRFFLKHSFSKLFGYKRENRELRRSQRFILEELLFSTQSLWNERLFFSLFSYVAKSSETLKSETLEG